MLLLVLWFLILLLSLTEFDFRFRCGGFYVAFVIVLLVVGLRNMGGEDFVLYKEHYERQIFVKNWEIGYVFWEDLGHVLNLDFYQYIFFSSLCVFLMLFRSFKDYSPYPLLTLLIYISSFIIYYNIIALRQMFAMTLIIYSFRYIENKENTKYLCCVLFASLFHYSALIFLLTALFVRFFNFEKKDLFICSGIVVFLSCFLNSEGLTGFFSSYGLVMMEERIGKYIEDSSGNMAITSIVKSLIVICLIYINYNKLKDKKYFLICSKIYFLYILLFVLFNQWEIMFRVWAYFEVASVFLLAIVVKYGYWGKGRVGRLIVFYLLVLLYFTSFFRNILSFDNGALLSYNFFFL